jgi:hypothetical protein
MKGTATPTPDTRTRKRTDRLRERAVLHEGERRDEQYARTKKGRKHQRTLLSAEVLEEKGFPLLAQHVTACNGWFPPITRSSTSTRRNLDAMRAIHGPLVLLRLRFGMVDALPLKSPEVRDMVRELLPVYFDILTLPDAPYTCSVKRGACGTTHAHLGLPLAFLAEPYASLVNAARHGSGGGLELLGDLVHGVVILDTPQDRARVATYLSRDPDERFDVPGTLAYLEAHEEALKRKVEGALAAVRLSWVRGVLPLRRVPHPSF